VQGRDEIFGATTVKLVAVRCWPSTTRNLQSTGRVAYIIAPLAHAAQVGRLTRRDLA